MTQEISCDGVDENTTQEWNYSVLREQFERIENSLQRYLRAVHQRVEEYSHKTQETMLSTLQMAMFVRFQTKIPACDIPVCQQSFREAERAVIPSESRLALLIARFGLNQFERDALLLALMPLANGNAGFLFACLQNDTHESWPGPELILNLLCRDAIERLDMQACLSPFSPLVRYALVFSGDPESNNDQASFLQGSMHIYRYLSGRDSPLGQACCRWLEPPTDIDLFPGVTKQLLHYVYHPAPALLISLAKGSVGSRQMALSRAAHIAGRKLLLFDMEQAPTDETQFCRCFVDVLRESTLYAAGLVLHGLHQAWQNHTDLRNWMSDRIREHRFPLFGLSETGIPLVPLTDVAQVLIEMPQSSTQDEARLLDRFLQRYRVEADVDTQMLVRRFRPPPDTLLQSLSDADAYRELRGADALSVDDLCRAFRQRSQQAFGGLATRVEPRRTFDDLIVAEGLNKQLEEVLAAVRFREEMLAQGFARKIAYGTGVSALFHGDSGTGKTLVAEVLAGALGVDMIKIDLATVVNKYIGETEKNLARIFDIAEADSGLLFFDEADALFGKRSETRDSHDRYANIEISYLLQRLESYTGLVILATNNRSHLDEAFTRRLSFIIRFPFPDITLRERMWRGIWPAEIRVAEDVDFAALARRAEITGANIRNIALLASWLAADNQSTCVEQKHIERALQRELAKMGRVV
ncbi:ATPase family associated with various cellular activities (AAA) [Kosakonia oryzendophytica]|uniref:ATPase family associated with various cellular activities (AAA) n=1 Tax=Kosakonia oryzendophytica TaxID=1005665 RepID=A0A1C3YQE1_9ENTR|nr:ATP-binding protein [Kosakonia oryzendophytica]SCB72281.1 ATPase family associated with various cellular activities (AAA) [Kosakonia oryzendophytica]